MVNLVRHQIVSLSNASLLEFPNNTLTNFTHKLPKGLIIKEGELVRVALVQLILYSELEDKERDVGYVKLHLNELATQQTPIELDQKVLARIPWESGGVSWNRIKVPVFLPLAKTALVDKLSFFITDEKNQQLRLKNGPTTVIILEMETIGGTMSETFSIDVNPRMSQHLFPRNSLSSFKVELPQSLNLDSSWEVCLHSIQVPKFLKLEDNHLELTLRRAPVGKGRMPRLSDSTVFKIKARDIDKITDMRLVNFHINSFFVETGLAMKYDSETGQLEVTNRPLNYRLRNKLKMYKPEDRWHYLEINPALCSIMNIEFDSGKGAQFEIPQGDDKSFILRPGSVDFNQKALISLHMVEHLAIYADLVKPSLVGNAIAPILEVVPTKALGLMDTKTDVFYAIKNPIYRPINPKIDRTLHFNVTTLHGRTAPLDFVNVDNKKNLLPLSFTLVFRKRK